ncbi:DNA helicase-2/ATP-dependent DNA helicase PcrA [Brachybacterium muris]|uniref:UvrD-helicase domain-containing protein n=1 Tax=Brachybacterium muris TaxID=219301 RepID=UPI00195DE38F|nr:UvrD-helicase domain-containing protein [Brachybacterium muris]MBM7499750.1 DNA helicase-2/ATP-dependent DNA helicase PcrA [Brachybacterium muris]MCT2260893.1 UvrD-helicase domain-containing protein [Brachybacterium muris]
MSSLFDDLSLPDSFRRLEGVRVDADRAVDGPPHQGAPLPPSEPPFDEAPPMESPFDEAPPPYDEVPPPEDEPPYGDAPVPGYGSTDRYAPPARPWAASDPQALASLVEGLNPPQREAVEHRGSPLLIVAGAGSGKTRVLTRRIAHLLASGEAMPGEILAITFTNKAAAEMRERVAELVGPAARSMWVSTFHSACVRILRRDAAAAGLKSSFTIYDSADSLRLITTIAKDLELDTKKNAPRAIASRVSSLKNDLIDPIDFADQAESAKNPFEKTLSRIYTNYTERLRQANAVDFDDLIGLTVQLLRENPAIREGYRRRFRHVMVDEYQDTNPAQYALVRELVGEDPSADLTVVGDSDQSIYAFRGATIRNIVEFEQDFPSARTIVLEQNYRSTQSILTAANAVIEENQGRRKKNLWTDQGAGDKITLYVADDEASEARYIGRQIDALVDDGRTAGDIAIFYRANAQSRALEDQLIRIGLPYKVVGGTRFYERREIKDAIAYLQVLANPADEINLRRILNVPKRGIGDRAEAAIAMLAERERISFGEALRRAEEAPGIATRSLNAVRSFVVMLEEMQELAQRGDGPAEVLEAILQKSGYYAELQGSDDPQDESRLENLAELISVASEFEAQMEAVDAAASEFEDEESDAPAPSSAAPTSDDEEVASAEAVLVDADGTDAPEGSLIDRFLEKVSLVADADQIPGAEDQFVTLMTLHTAKGLEFPVVFLTGLEDGTFPHQRTFGDPEQLEEERRLAYVGITRAREKLYLTRAQMRATWGAPQFMPASRFLDEVPEQVLDVARAGSTLVGGGYGGGYGSGGYGSGRSGGYAGTSGSSRGPAYSGGPGGGRKDVNRPSFGSGRTPTDVAKMPQLVVGDRVTHDTFGMGTVTEVAGQGEKTQVEVQFRAPHGKKRLLLRYAPITKL